MTTDAAMLEVALNEARAGLAEGGIPIGAAVFSAEGRLLGSGHNRRVQDGDPSVHGETDAFRRAGRQSSYRGMTMVTTLAPCWFCSGLVRQFGFRRVIVGESVTFQGGIDWLRENGIEVIDLHSETCRELLAGYIAANPAVWNEDIGVPAFEEIRASEDLREGINGKEEETPVIDVHAPHGGLHTWKDFWIHLGTITLGLLIAISLEQSVELVHRASERHQLEEDLRVEGENNRGHVRIDINVYDGIIRWLLELQRGVDAERDSGGKVAFVYPARPDGVPDSPRYAAYHVLETEAWDTAKSSSQLVLLPRNEAEIYARNYIQAEQVQEYRDRVRQIGIEQGAFESRFAHGAYPPAFDLSKLTPQQLDEYEAILTSQLEEIRVATSRLRIFNAANNYVLSGGRSESEIREAILKANSPQ